MHVKIDGNALKQRSGEPRNGTDLRSPRPLNSRNLAATIRSAAFLVSIHYVTVSVHRQSSLQLARRDDTWPSRRAAAGRRHIQRLAARAAYRT